MLTRLELVPVTAIRGVQTITWSPESSAGRRWVVLPRGHGDPATPGGRASRPCVDDVPARSISLSRGVKVFAVMVLVRSLRGAVPATLRRHSHGAEPRPSGRSSAASAAATYLIHLAMADPRTATISGPSRGEGVAPDVDRHERASADPPGEGSGPAAGPPPRRRKSCRPSRTDPARAIAAVSSGTRTPSAKRSRSGLRGPFQTV